MMRLVLAFLLAFLLYVPLQATSTIGDLKFATNFDTLMTQAQQSQKVIVLKFFTDW